ncbi:endonuclease/exonuclease/phosphatase family protein [Actinoplanes sp. NPDC049548]|uniref:endonuclease/exonuclease/phosphatase family protein n=1 Tax=Actinoplanes sp. NPDC049548 TaxID=3155152 RepID=UPI003426D947
MKTVESTVGYGPSRTGRSAAVLPWVLRAGAALLLLVVVLGHVAAENAVVLVAVTPVAGWLLVLAVPLTVVAVLRRQRVEAAIAVVLCLAHVTWLAGAYCTSGPQEAPGATATVRLLSANLKAGNSAVTSVARKLRDSGADVLSLQEVTPEHLARLRKAGLPGTYPYSVIDALPGFHGSAIFSKLPLTAARAFDVDGSPMTTATITRGGRTVRIVAVHAVAPLSGTNRTRWRAQLASLRTMLPAENSATVLIGDFNATLDHRSLADLTEAGWRDAFTEAGEGFGFTYPNGWGPVMPMLRLDHAMVSEPLTVLRAETGDNPGSDHRMLAVDIAVPAAS